MNPFGIKIKDHPNGIVVTPVRDAQTVMRDGRLSLPSPAGRHPASGIEYRRHAPGLCRCDQFLVIAGDLIGIGGGERGNRVVELVSPA